MDSNYYVFLVTVHPHSWVAPLLNRGANPVAGELTIELQIFKLRPIGHEVFVDLDCVVGPAGRFENGRRRDLREFVGGTKKLSRVFDLIEIIPFSNSHVFILQQFLSG